MHGQRSVIEQQQKKSNVPSVNLLKQAYLGRRNRILFLPDQMQPYACMPKMLVGKHNYFLSNEANFTKKRSVMSNYNVLSLSKFRFYVFWFGKSCWLNFCFKNPLYKNNMLGVRINRNSKSTNDIHCVLFVHIIYLVKTQDVKTSLLLEHVIFCTCACTCAFHISYFLYHTGIGMAIWASNNRYFLRDSRAACSMQRWRCEQSRDVGTRTINIDLAEWPKLQVA